MDNSAIVHAALQHLTEHYVFPERARAMAERVARITEAGDYDGLTGRDLCEAVTDDLQSVHSDHHLGLRWHDEPREDVRDDDARLAAWRRDQRVRGGGVRRVEVLDGNVGLIELTLVGDPELCGDAYAAAFRLVADTEALIVDLRRNGGGSPFGAALWCSYFFGSEPVHLNDIHDDDGVRQMWSSAHLPAPRYLNRPVYTLLSGRTFSGAEDVAYTLAVHGRTTTVGETTRGGAHPTEEYRITEHIDIRVPKARTVSTVTGANWEGTGVTPDVDCPAEAAFAVAYRTCLDHVLAATDDPRVTADARRALDGLNGQSIPTTPPSGRTARPTGASR